MELTDEAYELRVWPLGKDETDNGQYPEVLTYDEDNFGDAVSRARELITEFAENAADLWAAGAEHSERTLYGDRLDLAPYMEAMFELGLYAADKEREVTLNTPLEFLELATV